MRQNRGSGVVYLVGAGPGDPGLITVRGRNLLRRADVVVHDRLIGKQLLSEVTPDAELIDVGKVPRARQIRQEFINSILVDHARRGRMVVRLKGGDPFVFGRGYEELCACREAGVRCVVVPGVSSAIAAPAAAGIPITHRRLVRSFTVLTGSVASDTLLPPPDFRTLAAVDTLVILMGRGGLADLAQSLMAGGRSTATPAACIEWATTRSQRTVVATLGTIAQAAEREGLDAPVVTVVGEVAALAKSDCAKSAGLLDGRRVIITRPRSASARLHNYLSEAGAIVINCPLIRIVYPAETSELDEAISHLSRYRWVVFTSIHGIVGFWRRLSAAGFDARALGSCKVAAVGSATARSLRRRGISADLVPSRYTGEMLAQAIIEAGGSNLGLGRILYPHSDIAPATLQERLGEAGAVVDAVVAYQTVGAEMSAAIRQAIGEGIDAVVFCSPSAVRNFPRADVDLSAACIACLGPSTAAAAREAGMEVDIVPAEHTGEGLILALERHFAKADAGV